MTSQRGFTLIELLIVVGVLAVLATAVVLVLNPAEFMKKSRDATRLSDLATLNRAISFYQTDGGSSFGTANTVYVSIPDSSATCANLGLVTLPTGWSYVCASEANYQKADGNGWIPVDFTSVSYGTVLSTLPIDPINTTSTGNYYTYTGGSWHLRGMLESEKYKTNAQNDGGSSDNAYDVGSNLALTPTTFPNNWIKVPGDSSYDTSDFWVMKYEAKYDKTIDGVGDNASDASCTATSGDGLNWTGSGCSDATKIISSPYGSPIVHITHDQAVAACVSIGAHLLTNDEWMTIAKNAEGVDSNWSSGSKGTGCFFRGNNGTADACGYNGSDPEKGINRNSKAKLTLSNGEEIWDIAGNVWEHVRKDTSDTLIPQNQQPTLSTTADDAVGGGGWGEFSEISGFGAYFSASDIYGSYNSSSYGVGKIWTYGDNESVSTSRVLLRGGNWSNGVNAGAFTLNLNWGTAAQYGNVGFRCAR
jgi:prepilin-type N-terminal cleavage/methylation domain-containing protein